MNAKQVQAWFDDSAECFRDTEVDPLPKVQECWKCSECDEIYGDQESANDCCKES